MARRISLFRTLLIMATICFFSMNLSAQFSSTLEGTVTDPTGALIPDAEVTITNVDSGVSRTTRTTGAGYFRVPSLSAGVYDITVSLVGFKTVTQQNVTLEVRQTKNVPITLELGVVTEEVSVSAAPPQIDTSEASVSGLINNQRVGELPLVGRNFYTLVVLTPGVVGLPTGGGQAYAQASGDIFEPEFGVNMSANGQRAEANSFMIDGGTVNGSPRGGVTNINPNADSVQELRVSVNNYSAEYGRNSSAMTHVVTKGGTNDYHGTVSWFHTDNVLQARNIFQGSGPVFRRNEAAWSLGGPIRKNKTFAFGSMDILRSGVGSGFRRSVPAQDFINWQQTNNPGNLSTQAMTDFPAQFAPDEFRTAADIANVPCPAPGTLITTAAGNIPCDLRVIGTGTFDQTLPRDGIQWNTRIDHNIGDSDRIYGNFYRTTNQQVLFGSPSAYPAFTEAQDQYSVFFNLNHTHIFSPTLINEMAANFVKVWGDAPVTRGDIPTMNVDGIATIGGGWGPGIFTQNNFEWRDVVAYNRGKHNFKFGGKFQHNQTNSIFGAIFTRPNFGFNDIFDFANDDPFSHGNIGLDPATGEAFGPNLYLRLQGLALFVHDDWKVLPNLTFNLGLRYEIFLAPYEGNDLRGVVSFPTGSDLTSRIADAHIATSTGRLYNTPSGGWAPRIGIAWDPTGAGKFSIRAGAGVFYDRPAGQFFDDCCVLLPVFGTGSVDKNSVVQPNFGFGANSTIPFEFPVPVGLVSTLDSRGGIPGLRSRIAVADPNLENAYTINWSFGIQYALTNNWVAEANYIGSTGRHLYAQDDVNRFAGDLIDGIRNRLNPSFGTIEYGQANGTSNYTGGTASLKRRYSSGLDFQVAYTVGRAVDTGSSFDGAINTPVSRENQKLNRGRSTFDVRQKMATSFLYQLPKSSITGPLGGLVNGWQLGSIIIVQSGAPFDVRCGLPFNSSDPSAGCDWNADGMVNDRPNQPAFGNSLDGLTKQDFLTGIFTRSDFPTPAAGQVGNLGRNTFTGPGFATVDFSLTKNNQIPWLWGGEGANFQFRLEVFNLFNRVNLQNPSGSLTSSVFGQSTSSFAARNIQFGLRLVF